MNARKDFSSLAFSFIELITVIVVLTALTSLTFPLLSQLLEYGKSARCVGNLRQIGITLQGYLSENSLTLPLLLPGRSSKTEDVPVLETVLPIYGLDPKHLHCPADRKLFHQTGSSYFWNHLVSGQQITKLEFLFLTANPNKVPLVFDKEGWHRVGGRSVHYLFADGRVTSRLDFVVE